MSESQLKSSVQQKKNFDKFAEEYFERVRNQKIGVRPNAGLIDGMKDPIMMPSINIQMRNNINQSWFARFIKKIRG